MTLSIGSVFQPMNAFFLERFGTPAGSPVVFRFDQFGSTVSQDDFRVDPTDPASPFSEAVAAEKVSELVNRVPKEAGDGTHVVLTADAIDSFYADVVLRPAQPYLPAGSTPDERDDLVAAFAHLKAAALRQWDKAERTSVLGSPVGVHLTGTDPDRWWDPATTWDRHRFEITEAPEPQPSPPVVWRPLPTELQLDRVLTTFPVLPTEPVRLGVDRPPVLVPAPPPTAVQPLNRLRVRDLTLRVGVGREVSAARLAPSLRLRDRLAVRDRIRLNELLVQNVPAAPVTTDAVTIAFEYRLVTLTREWWSSLVNAPTWRIPGRERGALNAPGTPGGVDQLPIGFLAVRNVTVDARWSAADQAQLASAMSFGPFDVSASAGSQQVSQPGMQIVGWVLQGLPPLPPNPPVDGPAGTASATEPRTYRVKAGDTLAKIARRFYGDAAAYPRIAEANGISDPSRISVGQVLTVP